MCLMYRINSCLSRDFEAGCSEFMNCPLFVASDLSALAVGDKQGHGGLAATRAVSRTVVDWLECLARMPQCMLPVPEVPHGGMAPGY